MVRFESFFHLIMKVLLNMKQKKMDWIASQKHARGAV